MRSEDLFWNTENKWSLDRKENVKKIDLIKELERFNDDADVLVKNTHVIFADSEFQIQRI